MKSLIQPIPNALTIDIKLLSIKEMDDILKVNTGYVDRNSKKLVVFRRK